MCRTLSTSSRKGQKKLSSKERRRSNRELNMSKTLPNISKKEGAVKVGEKTQEKVGDGAQYVKDKAQSLADTLPGKEDVNEGAEIGPRSSKFRPEDTRDSHPGSTVC